VRHAAPEISLISFELSMLPQLVRMIVQPETLLRLPHLSRPKRALGGRPVGNAHEFIPENSMRAPLFRPGVRAIGCPANYGPREARKDLGGLHHFYCKRISPPSCGGGALSEAEDAEEAQLTARVAAFEESPEGLARQRILELEYADFSRRLSSAETDELESLRKAYPDLPPDPNDPLKDAFEAYAPGSAESSPNSKETRKS
jgi:hypothetical protein